jgi:hypothetical protein
LDGLRGEETRRNDPCADSRAKGARSDRERDLPDQTGENKQPAQAVAVALVRQKEAAEADQCGERHGDLTSSVHVSFPQCLPPMTLATNDRFQSLREAFVVGGTIVGEKQEQSKNKIALPAKFMRVVGRARPFPDLSPRPAALESQTATPRERRLLLGAAWASRLSRRAHGGRVTARGRSFVQRPGLLRAVIASSRFLLAPFIVRVALCPLIQNSMSASA